MINIEEAEKYLDATQYVLIGIGQDFNSTFKTSEILETYEKLADLIGKKDYFIVTLNTDDLVYESSLQKERIVAPCGSKASGNVITDENYDESCYLPQWDSYMKWLPFTLNREIVILELGVGMQYPSVVRWPFEKTAYYNQKSKFIRVHERLAQMPKEMKERGIAVMEQPISWLRGEQSR